MPATQPLADRHRHRQFLWLLLTALASLFRAASAGAQAHLPNTEPLALSETVVADHIRQAQRYFQQRCVDAVHIREALWKPDFTSQENYDLSVAPHRAHLRQMLGLVDDLPAADAEVVVISDQDGCRIERITVPLDGDWKARGLLIHPTGQPTERCLIVCPDADQTPEQFAGLLNGSLSPWMASVIARGTAVYVPQSIERLRDHPYVEQTKTKDRRHVLYRLGYIVGRTCVGMDVQEVLAAKDYLAKRPDGIRQFAICGMGQGGMTALYAGALDSSIEAVGVANYFEQRDRVWEEPVDRRLRGQLLTFGDAELAALIAPRPLVLLDGRGAEVNAPVLAEAERAKRFYAGLTGAEQLTVATGVASEQLLGQLIDQTISTDAAEPVVRDGTYSVPGGLQPLADAARNEHFAGRLAYLRRLIDESEAVRTERWKILQRPAGEFAAIQQDMLDDYRELVGAVETSATPLNPRTGLALTTDTYRAYRVLLDVAPGVEVYGNLLIPQSADSGPRPAVICQHGLNGTPEMVTGLGQKEDTVYHEFGRKLAERGYVVFAPLLAHYGDEETNLQVRPADAVGCTRIALPIAQIERVIDFLETLPEVDPERIGFYGLSYGGYTAQWALPLVDRIAASVISGNFNDIRQKITSDDRATSYLLHPYEDFYCWKLLHRFTAPELVVMRAPRPVCIEFGMRDGITTPEWTANAWRQTREIGDHVGLGDRIQLATFDGPHEIHGVETFDFLDRFLRAPAKVSGN